MITVVVHSLSTYHQVRMEQHNCLCQLWGWRSLLIIVLLIGFSSGNDNCQPENYFSSVTFFDTVSMGDFHVRIYQQIRNDLPTIGKKFYYTPLALLDHTSVSTMKNAFTREYELVFQIEMWTDELQFTVVDYLSNATKETFSYNQVSILPFDRVVLNCKRCPSDFLRTSTSYSFLLTPKRMEFRMSCISADKCRHLVQQMSENPKYFSGFSLHFLFDGDLKASSHEVNITSDDVWNQREMASMVKRYPNMTYLIPLHRQKMLEETLKNVVDKAHGHVNSVIDPEDESRLRKFLENQLFEYEIHPFKWIGGDPGKWKAVYWTDEITRPDLLAEILTGVYEKIADPKDKSVLAAFLSQYGLFLPNNITISTLKVLTTLSNSDEDQVTDFLNDNRELIEWDGTQFVPKKLFLTRRVELEKLLTLSKVFSFKRITPFLSVDVNIQPGMISMNFDRKINLPEYGTQEFQQLFGIKTEKKEIAETPKKSDRGSDKSGFFQTIKAAFTTSDLDMPQYTVLKTAEGYEERLYVANKWVKTQMKGISKDETQSTMFFKLFNYISGQNDQKTKIPMTAPVATLIEPGSGPNCESTFTMSFYIPPEFQVNTPQPTDPAVSIEERAEFKVFARTLQGPLDEEAFLEKARVFGELIQSNKVDSEGVNFCSYFSVLTKWDPNNQQASVEEIWIYGGFSNDQTTKNEHDNLLAALSETDKEIINPTGRFYIAGYDPPFKLFYRRNEIWLITHDHPEEKRSDQESCGDETSPSN